jgi:hypothetical protein
VAKLIVKVGFESSPLEGGAESYDRSLGGSDMVLPLVDLSCLDETGSSCKASLIALFWVR